MTDIQMLGFLLIVALATIPHVLALAASRNGTSRIHNGLFLSGIVGLLAPTILVFAVPLAMLSGIAGGATVLLSTLFLGSATAILLAWLASLGLLVASKRSSPRSHA